MTKAEGKIVSSSMHNNHKFSISGRYGQKTALPFNLAVIVTFWVQPKQLGQPFTQFNFHLGSKVDVKSIRF